MRLMDNCSLETESVKEIQDDLNYYLDCNQVGQNLTEMGVCAPKNELSLSLSLLIPFPPSLILCRSQTLLRMR